MRVRRLSVRSLPVLVFCAAVSGGCLGATSKSHKISMDVPAPMPAQPGAPPAAVQPEAVPAFAGGDTYVYIVNGVDFGRAGLSRLADQLRSSGFPNTRYGGWYQVRQFEREIRQLTSQNPNARVVMIGYSAGSYPVRAAVNRLTRDGVPVAMVGYIGGDYLRDTPFSRPAGVPVVNVRGDGFLLTGRNLFFNGTDLSGATNVSLRGTRHFGLPGHPDTFATLYQGINSATAAYPSAAVIGGSAAYPPAAVAAEPPVSRPSVPAALASPYQSVGTRR